MAFRLTNKTKNDNMGFLICYDEEDTTINNNEAIAGAGRYKRTVGNGYLGIMGLYRSDEEKNYSNYVGLLDGDLMLFNSYFEFIYFLAVSHSTFNTEKVDTTGYLFSFDPTYYNGNFWLNYSYDGVSRYYRNDLAYITAIDYQSTDIEGQYTLRFRESWLKSISLYSCNAPH